MGTYDFDKQVDRCKTNCLKYDFAAERGKPEGVLPLWVADMDFPTAQPIIDRLHQVVEHGIFGYSEVKGEYFAAAANWFRSRFGWEPQESWLVKTPGVVFALAAAIRGFTQPGDAVLIQPPVYYPFFQVIRDNNRVVVENELTYKNGRYEINLVDFETKLNGVEPKPVLRERLPELKLVEPDGTYFAWIDFSALGLEGDRLSDFVANRAHLWLDDGCVFGGHSDTFQRIALGCTRETLREALHRLERAVREYRLAA